MTTYVLRNGKLVEKSIASPLPSSDRPQRHISDTMEPTWHPASGRYFSSKGKFRAETRAHGCIEVGNDMRAKPRSYVKPDRHQRVMDIKRAIHQLQSR